MIEAALLSVPQVEGAQVRPSPNFALRPDGCDVRYVIVHGTWMADDEEALQRLCDPAAEVSCHYFIDAQGALVQMVAEEHTAWHAGVSAWGEVVGLNKCSIGIEISNPGEGSGVPYSDAQYKTLIGLLGEILGRHGLSASAVLGHSDIAPGRKDDPGGHFDWARLAAAGVGLVLRHSYEK